MRKQVNMIPLIISLLMAPKSISLEGTDGLKNPRSIHIKGLFDVEEIGLVTITSYRSTKQQCDSSPFFTSIGEHVHPGGAALSRDLLTRWKGRVNYGDTIFIEGLGFLRINDCMHQRMRRHIDVWVPTLEEEKKFQKKWHSGQVKIWLLKMEK